MAIQAFIAKTLPLAVFIRTNGAAAPIKTLFAATTEAAALLATIAAATDLINWIPSLS